MPKIKTASKRKNEIKKFIERVRKQKACGIIYNFPKSENAVFINNFLDDKNIAFDAIQVYTSDMLRNRLASWLKIRGLQFNMLPSLIENKIICVYRADMIKSSYSRVLDDFHKNKVPLLLIMNDDKAITNFRKFAAYKRVLTIEADYKIFN